VVADVKVLLYFLAIALKLDESIGQPYFLNAAFGQHLVGFYLDEFIFYGTASAIKH
jgi:hypothetical protein